MKAKRVRLLNVTLRLVCRWGLQTKPEASESRKGRKLAFRCHDCETVSHFSSYMNIPPVCPCCDNGGFLPHWAARTVHGLTENVFEYGCVLCAKVSTFDADYEVPDRCPHCGKASKRG
jgi:rubrerythrin